MLSTREIHADSNTSVNNRQAVIRACLVPFTWRCTRRVHVTTPRVHLRHEPSLSTTCVSTHTVHHWRNIKMTTALRSSDSSLEADLERAELLQNKDAAKAEEGYRAVLDRKAGGFHDGLHIQLTPQTMRRSSNARRPLF